MTLSFRRTVSKVVSWTPTFTAEGTPPTGVTYTTQSADYEFLTSKTALIRFFILLSSKGSGGVGNVNIAGFPFTFDAISAAFGGVVLNTVDFSSGYTSAQWLVNGSSSILRLFEIGDNVAAQAVAWGAAGNSSVFRGTGLVHIA